ncbi:hypothetical protein [Deinococcus sp. Leaf326]|uniref:hypothetical protein n=1 Tax=Deinococcus sp. Leaf326 TaxID=1736338 RepID=UPI0006F815AC|nr:hypothetical protein [Deinococcus sp. Leaf326]KQQ99364.1 hypothetical protein ASF71_13335 [Deinococcus sp. Leaf326]
MRVLILGLLLLSPVASAGGGALQSPPAAGQVWTLNATRRDGLSVSLQLKLGRLLPGDSPDQVYAAEGLIGGGAMLFSPRERGIDATIMELNSIRCFAQFTPGAKVAHGVLLYGSTEWNSERLNNAQKGSDFSREALLRGLRPLSDGTCTLERLR